MGGVASGAFVCLAAAGCLYLFHILDKRRAAQQGGKRTWRYCPWCAADLVPGDIGGKHKLHCSRCDFVLWDNPKPKAKTLIPTVDDGIVLIRGLSGGLELPGGYLEPLETLEEGALRETLEETHLVVEIVCELGMVMPPGRNEHEHFFLTKPVSQKPVPGDDAVEAIVAPIANIPFDQIKIRWHRDIIKQWLANRGRC